MQALAPPGRRTLSGRIEPFHMIQKMHRDIVQAWLSRAVLVGGVAA